MIAYRPRYNFENRCALVTGGTSGMGRAIAEGHHTDLVLFDPERIEDAATYENPVQPARAIRSVFVNAVRVWSNGESSGQRSGTFIAR